MEDVLYLPPIVERSIQDWIKIRKTFKAVKKENEKYLFIHPNNFAKGKRISYWAVQRLCKKIGELAGIKEVITTPSLLKRTEITRDFEHFQNFRIPQMRARHTCPFSTLRYCTKTDRDVVRWIRSKTYIKAIKKKSV